MFRHLLRATVGLIVASGSLFCLALACNGTGLFGWWRGRRLYQRSIQLLLRVLSAQPADAITASAPGGHAEPGGCTAAILLPRWTAARCTTRSLADGDQSYDPLHPYSGQNQERIARPFRFAQDPSNARWQWTVALLRPRIRVLSGSASRAAHQRQWFTGGPVGLSARPRGLVAAAAAAVAWAAWVGMGGGWAAWAAAWVAWAA